MNSVVTAALQKIQDLACDPPLQMLLAECSLAELNLAELSLAKSSLAKP